MKKGEFYRAASWWLTWEDMIWPDEDIADKFKRRADKALESGVNMAVIYGAHFRWDFMPLWMNLHDMIRFVADELHQRGILLFDHHSSVLTHRYANIQEARAMREGNRHHLSFAPSRDIANEWTYKGMKLNDWRMIDLVTGKPVFLERYTAEQFCMNNPYFQKAYQEYVRRLLDETGIDGLMSDDGIYYSGWTSCGCEWCRKKFQDNCGHLLPDVSDANFWGNPKSDAFKDWVEMRYVSTREFLEGVRSVVGKDFSLMTCCSDSVGSHLPAYGMTYQEFIKPCNHIMLEMCGNTPALNGTWSNGFPSQMLHVGIAAESGAPCIGLGYGFTEPAADFIWAFNKFLGAGTWLSSIKGRLGLRESQTRSLKDDMELPGNGFNFEKNNMELFDAETDTDMAVFYSRWTRDFYGMTQMDYVNDFRSTCSELLNKNITFDIVTNIPKASEYKVLILSSVSCLSDEEYSAVDKYLEDGGIIVASGPLGIFDRRGKKRERQWLAQFDARCEIEEPERIPAFPPWSKQEAVIPCCKGYYKGAAVVGSEWISLRDGKLLWTPERMQEAGGIGLAGRIASLVQMDVVPEENSGWRFRSFRKNGKLFIHALAAEFDIGLMDDLEKLRKNYIGNNLINRIRKKRAVSDKITLVLEADFSEIKCYVPLKGIEESVLVKDAKIDINVDDDVYYLIISLTR